MRPTRGDVKAVDMSQDCHLTPGVYRRELISGMEGDVHARSITVLMNPCG